MVTIELTGLQACAAAFQDVARRGAQAMLHAVQQEAERILEASQPLVPVDTGLLRSTGIVETLQDGAEISYGGKGLAPYAIAQHVNTAYHHPHGGQPYFLQEPFFAATGAMLQRLAAEVAQALERTRGLPQGR